jgi:hypothetical protein
MIEIAEEGCAPPERRIGAQSEWKVTWPRPGDAAVGPELGRVE